MPDAILFSTFADAATEQLVDDGNGTRDTVTDGSDVANDCGHSDRGEAGLKQAT